MDNNPCYLKKMNMKMKAILMTGVPVGPNKRSLWRQEYHFVK